MILGILCIPAVAWSLPPTPSPAAPAVQAGGKAPAAAPAAPAAAPATRAATKPLTATAKLENRAINFANKKLDGGPIDGLGRVAGSKREPTLIRNAEGKVTGVRMWTGDEASEQDTNFIVKVNAAGKPVSLKVDNSP
jgi:hypothetical protein